MTGRRISEIRLKDVAPDVFSDTDVAASGLWLADFAFCRGRDYLVEAASGAGKSSLCSFIYCERKDYRGRIAFDGRDAARLSVKEVCDLRRRHLSLLPQELRLFPELSAVDNILLKNRLTDYRSEAEIRAMLDRLELAAKCDTPVGRLSIGQMQRVAIVRALCQPFDFLLLDEPVSHLDSRCNRMVADLVSDEAGAQTASVIATSVGNPLLLRGEVVNVKL